MKHFQPLGLTLTLVRRAQYFAGGARRGAFAFQHWLMANGWAKEDVFIDLHGIGAGERWRDTLRKVNAACEAVILLAPRLCPGVDKALAPPNDGTQSAPWSVVTHESDTEIARRRADGTPARACIANEVGNVSPMPASGDPDTAIDPSWHSAATLVEGGALEAGVSPLPNIACDIQ